MRSRAGTAAGLLRQEGWLCSTTCELEKATLSLSLSCAHSSFWPRCLEPPRPELAAGYQRAQPRSYCKAPKPMLVCSQELRKTHMKQTLSAKKVSQATTKRAAKSPEASVACEQLPQVRWGSHQSFSAGSPSKETASDGSSRKCMGSFTCVSRRDNVKKFEQ